MAVYGWNYKLQFPKQTIDKVELNQKELTAIKTETQTKLINSIIITDNNNIKETSAYFTKLKLDTEQIEKWDVYSQYLTDPNQHKFKTFVRIIAIVTCHHQVKMQSKSSERHQTKKVLIKYYLHIDDYSNHLLMVLKRNTPSSYQRKRSRKHRITSSKK